LYAADIRIQGVILELVELAKASNVTVRSLADSATARAMGTYLRPLLETRHYIDYLVLSPEKTILAARNPGLVMRPVSPGYDFFLRRALSGRSAISRPFQDDLIFAQDVPRPIMFVAAPIVTSEGRVAAVLLLRMRPEDEFSRIFAVARMGEIGESYAFDRRGFVLTESRQDAELKKLGLIANTPDATSILNLRLTDPGVDLEHEAWQTRSAGERPLTRMAAEATKGWDGVDVQGYRDYLGRRVVGAWGWVPEYGMGVATEVAADEAFQTLYVLRRAFVLLFLLLMLSGVAIFAFTLLIERMQTSMRKSALAARQLGPYVLMQEIGRGANGMVYRARHSLLRRPVAIKLLSPEMTNEHAVARFEHEVQMTSQLTHPNTVAIYDYGRTPEGLFYYAMEYLSGIDLDQLVRRYGPQPEGRVIHVLRQVCGSLAEAHQVGLVHRDIKPANIVLTRRGGVYDMVKVLDFGLVRTVQVGSAEQPALNAVVGTPHFMSPEAITNPANVDSRTDLYSLGAVGYWLLTGRTLFDSDEVDELLKQHVKVVPANASERLGSTLSPDLERVIMRCVAKVPERRYSNAASLEQDLAECMSASTWTAQDAEKWWRAHMTGFEVVPAAKMAEKTLVIAERA
jgi:tRNA A-37 threonylcarbamoyl transferase component Bud32